MFIFLIFVIALQNRHRVTSMLLKYRLQWQTFLRNFFLPVIVRSVCYRSPIDKVFYCSINSRKIKNKHDTLNFLSLARHHVSLDICDTIFKRLSQINWNFMEIKRVFRGTSSHEITNVLRDLVVEKNRKDCSPNVIASRSFLPIYI